ncbi:hypothetical protein IGS61_26130 [Janthinobacterium sp. FW305-129]|uniref:hypothetical protein n=1 Tax=Janthinobacterium sp. FW305-129 TaxID=2775054 RepID=UPI001E3B4350|nr:hypothetical protein [Janthinobacterium sp. FW305-129]MCC7600992.1 hypothetical protein [Janthinobacterium sp. FW305-129]
MLSFATEVPVPIEIASVDFFAAVKKWLLGSRYTNFNAKSLAGLGIGEAWDAVEETESIESICESTADSESAAVIYRKSDADFEWITTIVLALLPSTAWVSIRIECDPLHPRAKVPVAKKPVLLRVLLEELGCGVDGEFKVADTPVVFTSSEIDLAASCVRGETYSYMPIIYVSAPFHGPYLVDPNALAALLTGMAHVVVEPNRDFSLGLMALTQRKNVYGGTIALYWPEGGGKRSFFASGAVSAGSIEQLIFDELRLSLINRRPMVRCTLAAIKELKSRRLINCLKDEGSKETQNYVDLYEDELRSKDAGLQAAESEIIRLKAEVRRYAMQDRGGDGITLDTGGECDLYEGEILDSIMEALESGIGRVTPDGRRQHILQALVSANVIGAERVRNREKIKTLLRGYQSMDARTKRDLEQIGFSISEDGKHCKLVYQNDSRYTFILPKSGSDYRGGLNAAGDICRLLF